jgi:hypothetical protein
VSVRIAQVTFHGEVFPESVQAEMLYLRDIVHRAKVSAEGECDCSIAR